MHTDHQASNTAPHSAGAESVARNVVQINARGFTRMDNDVIDALMAINMPACDIKVALFVAKRTINFQAGPARIAATDISKATNMHPDVASKAISRLLKRRVIFREGGSRGDIGLCDPKDWVFVECPKQIKRSDSDQKGVVVQLSKQTKPSDSFLYSKKEPLVTVPTEQITAPQGAEPTPIDNGQEEASAAVEFNGEDFKIAGTLITKWAKAYAPIDVESEIVRAAAWASGSKPKKDWRRFLVNWLGREFKRNSRGAVETGVPVDKIIALYHKACPNLAAVAVANDPTLRTLIVERWNESDKHQSSEFWRMIFDRANRLNQVFFRGENAVPRLESICSRAVFRSLEEQA